jgi:hypothetical protein
MPISIINSSWISLSLEHGRFENREMIGSSIVLDPLFRAGG